MIIDISVLFSSVLIFLGIFAGVFLAYHTCEELKAIEKALKISKQILYVLGLVLIDYALLDWSIGFFIMLPIIAIIYTIISGMGKYFSISAKKFEKFERYFDDIMMIMLILVFSFKKNIVIGAIALLLGIIIGTLTTKRYLFRNFNSEKFNTATSFENRDKLKFYINAFKKHQVILYITFISNIILIIL